MCWMFQADAEVLQRRLDTLGSVVTKVGLRRTLDLSYFGDTQ